MFLGRNIHITIPQQYAVPPVEAKRIFMACLEELTEGWYLALSDGTFGREESRGKKNKYDSTGRWVLCHESEPHPHDGDTFREHERSLEDPTMHIIRYAVELKDVLTRSKA